MSYLANDYGSTSEGEQTQLVTHAGDGGGGHEEGGEEGPEVEEDIDK